MSNTRGLERITRNGFVANGDEYSAVCIIFASGFEMLSEGMRLAVVYSGWDDLRRIISACRAKEEGRRTVAMVRKSLKAIKASKLKMNCARIIGATEKGIRRHMKEDGENPDHAPQVEEIFTPRVIRKRLNMTQQKFADTFMLFVEQVDLTRMGAISGALPLGHNGFSGSPVWDSGLRMSRRTAALAPFQKPAILAVDAMERPADTRNAGIKADRLA